jgi:hypothetical protein
MAGLAPLGQTAPLVLLRMSLAAMLARSFSASAISVCGWPTSASRLNHERLAVWNPNSGANPSAPSEEFHVSPSGYIPDMYLTRLSC